MTDPLADEFYEKFCIEYEGLDEKEHVDLIHDAKPDDILDWIEAKLEAHHCDECKENKDWANARAMEYKVKLQEVEIKYADHGHMGGRILELERLLKEKDKEHDKESFELEQHREREEAINELHKQLAEKDRETEKHQLAEVDSQIINQAKVLEVIQLALAAQKNKAVEISRKYVCPYGDNDSEIDCGTEIADQLEKEL